MAGELNEQQSLMFRCPRPVEELYDIQADPFEMSNLSSDPAYAADRARLSGALDDWCAAVGDMGRIAETEMVRRWYPNGQQPATSPPVFIPISTDGYGRDASDGGDLSYPALVQLYNATQGASMAYTFEAGSDARWSLYTEPLRLPVGRTRIRAKAVRIG
jgi:hypothetical protein